MGNSKPEGADDSKPRQIKIDYIKSNQFRVVHADGIFGGITPRGHIHMDVWSERPPIPKRIVHELIEGEGLGDEIESKREMRDTNLIREVETGIVFDLGLAKAAVRWLQSKIDILEKSLEVTPIAQPSAEEE